MNTKLIIYLLPLIVLMGGSCANKKRLASNQVSTLHVNGNQENVWKGAEASKKIPLKSLRVLVIDGTGTQQESLYKDPLRVYANQPVSTDSIIESQYYNLLFLKAFKEKLPRKAKVWILTKKLSEKGLDSLVHGNRIDLVITARQIRFDYKFRYAGLEEFNRNLNMSPNNRTETGTTSFSPGKPSRNAGNVNSLGPAFDFPSAGRQSPVITRTIACYTCWDLQWTATSPGKDSEIPLQQLKQESTLSDHHNYAEIVFSSAATQAGKCLAQVFSW